MAVDPFSGPIPGENYTSDTKNYHWHRPPEVSDLDDAIELASKRLTNPEVLPKIITMMKIKLPLVRIADIFVTGGIGAGKWTPDMAIMLAGPVTHMLMILAKGYGIKNVNTGLDKKRKMVSSALFEEIGKINKAKAELAAQGVIDATDDIQEQAENVPEVDAESVPVQRSGFGGMANTMGMIVEEGENPEALGV